MIEQIKHKATLAEIGDSHTQGREIGNRSGPQEAASFDRGAEPQRAAFKPMTGGDDVQHR
jgi:hypothetical protein